LIWSASTDIAFLLVSSEKKLWNSVGHISNVFCFEGLTRDETLWLILQSDCGLALYGDYGWSRFGDLYGSSLKYYEYAANGLCIVATPSGHLKHVKGEGVCVTNDIAEMLRFIRECSKGRAGLHYRSWKDVALETAKVINSII
jgi:hypothetical protein